MRETVSGDETAGKGGEDAGAGSGLKCGVKERGGAMQRGGGLQGREVASLEGRVGEEGFEECLREGEKEGERHS